MRAVDLLGVNQTAFVIFTRGSHFALNPDGTGSTGHWVLNPDLVPDKIIVYHRTETGNNVYLGNFSGIEPSPRDRRFILYYSQMTEIGSTDLNWFQFAGNSRSPAQFITT